MVRRNQSTSGSLTSHYNNREEPVMPVLLVPLLIGVPVVLVGGYYIIHAMH
jgi:hypothetical protein